MKINLHPDISVEPGHQYILLPATDEGRQLAALLTRREQISDLWDEALQAYKVPHNAQVDARIIELVDWLSHVRFTAHSLLQLTFIEASANASGQETTR